MHLFIFAVPPVLNGNIFLISLYTDLHYNSIICFVSHARHGTKFTRNLSLLSLSFRNFLFTYMHLTLVSISCSEHKHLMPPPSTISCWHWNTPSMVYKQTVCHHWRHEWRIRTNTCLRASLHPPCSFPPAPSCPVASAPAPRFLLFCWVSSLECHSSRPLLYNLFFSL